MGSLSSKNISSAEDREPALPAFCVISGEMPEEMRSNLANFTDEVIPLPPDDDLAEPVRCHPDMVFAVLNGRLFVHRRYIQKNPATIEQIVTLGGFDLTVTDDRREARHPYDVGFNVAVWRDCFLCRPDVTSPALLDHAQSSGYRVIPLRQGYAGCSCLTTDDAVYTLDRGIAKSLGNAGIPCVLLDGTILLPGYNGGFLGGATGYIDGKIFLCGRAFPGLSSHVIPLADAPVTDYGGIKFYRKR